MEIWFLQYRTLIRQLESRIAKLEKTLSEITERLRQMEASKEVSDD